MTGLGFRVQGCGKKVQGKDEGLSVRNLRVQIITMSGESNGNEDGTCMRNWVYARAVLTGDYGRSGQ